MENRVERTTRRDHKRPLSPLKYALGISPSELIAHLKCQDFVTWPKKLPENPARDTTKETYGLGNESKEQRMVQQIEDTPSPPPVRKTIGVICGGLIYGGETVTAVKSHRRKAKQLIATILPDDPIKHSITFHTSEATSLSRPHDDALVLTLNVSNCEVGKIKLPAFAVGENKLTTFLVLDCPSAYNIILGRSWIRAMKTVPSTYHQRIKFLTKRGVKEIKRN
ncbi:hypothetical protein TIFTF001_020969 [Ficus carica]|uniref:Uncharacterized protein n=1 Tax=Ficus carica TaxID=3494 RepID=A0AA88AJJ9_FICCA|nr:hypothetical protein TIFTF001_020969 [Ficus carica]